MAKSKHPLVKFAGNIGGITFVDSKTYNPHPRQPRGTHNKIKINSVLEGNTKKPEKIKAVASPLLQVFKTIAGNFAESQLWQNMMRRMLKLQEISINELTGSLKDMELNSAYPLERLLTPLPTLHIAKKKTRFIIELENRSDIFFDKKVKADWYYFEIFMIWIGEDVRYMKMDRMKTEWIEVGKRTYTYAMLFEKPAEAEHFILVLKAAGGRKGKEIESMNAMGMKVMEGM